MKVAVCLSGQTRTIEQCIDSLLEYVVQPLNADTFFHFWTDSVVPNKLYDKWYQLNEPPKWPDFADSLALSVFNKLKPKSFIVQPQIPFDESYFRDRCTLENSRLQAVNFKHPLSMYYSILAANSCKIYWETKNNFIYDVVIRCRPDLKFHAPISQEHLTYLMLSSGVEIFIPTEGSYGGYNDAYAFGGNIAMNAYADCFNEIINIFESGTNFHPESILKKHISNHNLKVIGIPSNFTLVR